MVNNRIIKVFILVVLLTMIGYLTYQIIYLSKKNNDIQSHDIIITEDSISSIDSSMLGDKKVDKIGNNISFEYYFDKEKYISLENAFPVTDEVGKSLQGDKVQYFKLKFNKNAIGVKYVITVQKDINSTLDDEYIKLYLVSNNKINNCYRDNNRVKTFNEYNEYNKNERILYESMITKDDISLGYKEFVFKMWLSEDLKLDNSDYLSDTKIYGLRVNVYAIKE